MRDVLDRACPAAGSVMGSSGTPLAPFLPS
uniref:Uncharacterized protein n=1 Tax=Anguilla anguilla TaxID=7936 RepID=A0A0E9UVG0_ANGAN